MEFKWVTFWVQVHDIRIQFRNRRVVENICEAIGKVNVMLDENKFEGDGFVRIRVTIDISKPLCCGRAISIDSGKELWVSFKYERLPNICVAALRMMIGIANNGLNQKEACQLNLNSLDHGFVLHLLFHQGKTSSRSLVFTLDGEKNHLLHHHQQRGSHQWSLFVQGSPRRR